MRKRELLKIVCACVRVCVCAGLLIEVWKVTKVVEIRLDRHNLIAGVLPRISFIDRPSYQSSTKKYDLVTHTHTHTHTHVVRIQLTLRKFTVTS